jgi:hypothetical protein
MLRHVFRRVDPDPDDVSGTVDGGWLSVQRPRVIEGGERAVLRPRVGGQGQAQERNEDWNLEVPPDCAGVRVRLHEDFSRSPLERED